MARLRLGVALLVGPPLGDELDGLRRALGDPVLGRVPAHLTLVPPVNVREDALQAALATLRRAAAGTPPRLTLTLGPVTTFLPDNPVLYLAAGGDLEALKALRDRVFTGPLERPLTWPFVPHVTLTDNAASDRIAAATAALGDYHVEVGFDRIHLLQEAGRGSERRWAPITDAAFGPPAIIGRGGLALELSRSERLDPEARSLVRAAAGESTPSESTASESTASESTPGAAPTPSTGAPAAGHDPGTGRRPMVITARREGEVVGVAAAWMTDGGARIAVVVGAGHRRQGIGGHLLAAAESAVASAGWSCRQLDAVGPAGFYAARSQWSVASSYSKTIDE